MECETIVCIIEFNTFNFNAGKYYQYSEKI